MGIGTSQGAFYEDSFHQAAAQWDPKYDENEITPSIVEQNKQLNDVEMTELGGIPVADKTTPTGKYIGDLGKDDDLSYNSSIPIGRRNGDKIERHTDPEEYMKSLPADQEGYTLPDNPTLFIRKKTDEPLVSENKGLPILKVANITNTPAEIMDGLEGSRSYPSGFSKPERIKSAALIHNGETYEDINHGLALGRILDQYPDVSMKNIKDGFTTTHGRFVSREEAMGIAQSQRQINHPDIPNYGMLLSEDLK